MSKIGTLPTVPLFDTVVRWWFWANFNEPYLTEKCRCRPEARL